MLNFIGQSLGRYHILEQLGEGGMATVYKAYDTRLERNVAVKVILPSKQQSDRSLKRFEREAKALAQISHPNIVHINDFGEQDGIPFLVMDYLPGGTLKQKMGQPMRWQDAVKLLLPVARALAYAHGLGIIHRDVKPSNILLSGSGEPLLSDFGVAKILESEDTVDLTGTSLGVGTPEYMAPEYMTHKATDQRVDIYALGVVLYELVVGRKPYQADTPLAVLYKHASEPLPRPKHFTPDLPDVVEQMILKALAKKPEDRYETADQFADAMANLLTSSKMSGSIISKPFPLKRQAGTTLPNKKWLFIVVGILIFLGIAAGIAILLISNHNPSKQVPSATASLSETAFPARALIPSNTATRKPTQIPISTITSIPVLPTAIKLPAQPAMNVELSFVSSTQISSNRLTSVVFSQDNKWIAIGSDDGNAYLFKLATGSIITLTGHKSVVGSVAFSPNSEILATSSVDNTIKIWRVSDGQLLNTFTASSAPMLRISISPDGGLLASCTEGPENSVKIWNTSDWSLRNTLTGYGGRVWYVVFSPKGDLLASASDDGTIKLWDVATGQLVKKFVFSGSQTSVQFTPDGRILIAVSGVGEIRLIDVYAQSILQEIPGPNGLGRSAVNSEGTILVTVGGEWGDQSIWLWQVFGGYRLLETKVTSAEVIRDVAINSKGQIAIVSHDGKLRLYNLTIK
jgi:serine/threonine protein kinase